MTNKIFITGLSLTFAITAYSKKNISINDDKNNILFIICDDLRPELNCYGQEHIKSPNIDKMASNSVIFNKAFCNIPVSGASRASILTGMRPTKNTLSKWDTRVDKDIPEVITLQEHFKNNGFSTVSNGKVYHHQDEHSMEFWDHIMSPEPKTPMRYLEEQNIALMNKISRTGNGKRGYFYENGDFKDEDYLDWKIATQSIDDLKQLKQKGEPFFMAVGFILPHLPFVVPEKYWNLYDNDSIIIPDNYTLKEGNNIPKKALPAWGELRAYSGIPEKGALDENTAKNMIHGYYASVSFVDAQIGRLLDELEELGLDQNTTVILIGDHGWNLGEHGGWCKHTVLNSSLRSTLIIRTPEATNYYKNDEIVEYIDLFPTMCNAAGIPIPKNIEGESLLPLVLSDKAKSKGYAVSRWDNGFTYLEDTYSYTEWRDKEENIIDRLLFNHRTDPNENYNIVDKKENEGLVEKLSLKLNKRKGLRYLK